MVVFIFEIVSFFVKTFNFPSNFDPKWSWICIFIIHFYLFCSFPRLNIIVVLYFVELFHFLLKTFIFWPIFDPNGYECVFSFYFLYVWQNVSKLFQIEYHSIFIFRICFKFIYFFKPNFDPKWSRMCIFFLIFVSVLRGSRLYIILALISDSILKFFGHFKFWVKRDVAG